ncbi:MAG: DUF4091 domain-containing protein, partial [Acidobacteria bacterium]|nr:DUF4091 domain-containing protein [Acidobacteriota bacterium]
VYTGNVTVTRDAGIKLADVPFSVTVWDFELPKAPSLRSAFHDYDAGYRRGAVSYYGYVPGGAQHLSLAKAMDEDLLAHRLMPESPFNVGFSIDSTGHIVPNPEGEAVLESWLARPEVSDYKLYFNTTSPFADPLGADRAGAINYLRDAYEWLSSRGFLNKVWLRQVDDPDTPAKFQLARDLADLIHQANPNYNAAVTAQFYKPGVASYLYGHLNILIMAGWSFDPVASAQRQAARNQIWSFNALAPGIENPSPFWQIDFPLLNFRIFPWINFRYGLTGLLYWTTAYWEEIQARGASPWTDPCSYRSGASCFNGDGMLVYPGKEVNYLIPQNAYGQASSASVYGPIPSLRLKALRDGMEDYELLALAASRDPSRAKQIVIQVACAGNPDPGNAAANCFHHWNQDPDGILQARAQLASIITAPR